MSEINLPTKFRTRYSHKDWPEFEGFEYDVEVLSSHRVEFTWPTRDNVGEFGTIRAGRSSVSTADMAELIDLGVHTIIQVIEG